MLENKTVTKVRRMTDDEQSRENWSGNNYARVSLYLRTAPGFTLRETQRETGPALSWAGKTHKRVTDQLESCR